MFYYKLNDINCRRTRTEETAPKEPNIRVFIILIFFLPYSRILPLFFVDEQYLLSAIFALFVFDFCVLKIYVYFVVAAAAAAAVVVDDVDVDVDVAVRIVIVPVARAAIVIGLFSLQHILRQMRKAMILTST
jgi:hypothetical protein